MLVAEEALVKLTEHAESQDDQIGISLNKKSEQDLCQYDSQGTGISTDTGVYS